MSRQLIVKKLDDFDGSPAEQTREFMYEGWYYTIDLSDVHAKELDDLLGPYCEHAFEKSREKPGKQTAGKQTASTTKGAVRQRVAALIMDDPNYPDKQERHAIRAWAKKNNIYVGGTGTIPQAVINEYRRENGGPALLRDYGGLPLRHVGPNGQPVPISSERRLLRDSRAEMEKTVKQRPIREWANANGYDLGVRKPIPADVFAAYRQANPESEVQLNGAR